MDTGQIDAGPTVARPAAPPGMLSQRTGLFIVACLMPATIALAAIVVYPLLYGVALGFTNANPLTLESRFVGLENYDTIRTDSVYWGSLWRTVLFTAGTILLEFPLALALALMLNEPLRGRAVYRTLLLVPWVMPNVVAAIIWKWIYSPEFGLLNYALWKLSLIDSYIGFLSNADLALPAVIVIAAWKGLPFSIVVLLAGLQAIPGELYEAARVDGANAWQRFRHITVPQLLHIIVIVLVLRAVWTFNSFDLVYVLTGGGPGWATQLLSIYVYLSSFQYQQMGYGAAMAATMLIIMAALAVLFVRRVLPEQA